MRVQFWSIIVTCALVSPGSAQTTNIPRVGLLSCRLARNPPNSVITRLAELGYVAGKTFTLECRSGEQSYDQLVPAAQDLVRAGVNVIVAMSHPTAQAAHSITDSVPIVMIASGDPVGSGLVKSLAHPGGNVTGLTYYATELTEKRLELLREMVPSASLIGVLSNPAVSYLPFEDDTKRAARLLDLQLAIHETTSPADLPAVFVLPDLLFGSEAQLIAELALRHHLPTMAWGGWFTKAGGLMAYSAEYGNMGRVLAGYVDKVLKGERPGDIPVDQPTRFVLSVNLQTAKALGLTVPTLILSRTDEVIE